MYLDSQPCSNVNKVSGYKAVSCLDRKQKILPKKKAQVDRDANLSWTVDQDEILLEVVRAYSSQMDYEGLE